MRRLLVLGTLSVVALLAAALLFSDPLARTIAARAGTAVTGLQTTVGGADVGKLTPSLELRDVRVLNPEGFASAELLTFDTVSARTTWGRILRRTAEVPEIELGEVCLTLERGEGSGFNLNTMAQSLERFRIGQREEKEELVVSEVRIDALNVTVPPLPLLGDQGRLGFRVEAVVVRGLRTRQTGVLARDLAAALMMSVLVAARRAGMDSVPPPAGELLERVIESLEGATSLEVSSAGARLIRGAC